MPEKPSSVVVNHEFPSDSTCLVRAENLSLVASCCKELGLRYWLSGRTMLYGSKLQCLPIDNFDSIGVEIPDEKSCTKLLLAVLSKGFKEVKRTVSNSLLKKDGHLLEIDYFIKNDGKYSFRGHSLATDGFQSLEEVLVHKHLFSIPTNADKLIHKLYTERRDVFFTAVPKAVQDTSIFAIRWMRHLAKRTLTFFGYGAGKSRILSEDEFRHLQFERDLFNKQIRKPHLDIITDNGKIETIGGIIDYLKNREVLEKVKKDIIETPMSKSFLEPMHFDHNFWHSGNNFFINCILYSFRHGIPPYEEVNEYRCSKPALYSGDFYRAQPEMSDHEIVKILADSPIILKDGALISGRHRACAMIGRLISGKPYIPFIAKEL